jgi:hypothetical protein
MTARILLLYVGAFAFLILGIISIMKGIKKKDMNSIMLNVNKTSPKNFGRLFLISLGVLLIYLCIALLIRK